MKSIDFPGVNAVYGANQPEYFPLHAIKTSDEIATISCWELDEADLAKVNETKQIFLSLFTFGQPIQPQRISAELSDLVTFDNDANLVVPEEQREECEKARMPATLPDAIHKLRRILQADSEYYMTWEHNIAVQFQAEFKRRSEQVFKNDMPLSMMELIDSISTQAAKNFLNALIKG